MAEKKLIDWKSKLIDLMIVTIGITVAFKLNSWNENKKTEVRVREYVVSFKEENDNNIDKIQKALDFSKIVKANMDTLKLILTSKRYDDERILVLVGSMMGLSSYSPTITAMDNITAGSDFDLLQDSRLRNILIDTYGSFDNSSELESILYAYVDTYATPFFMKNIRFSDFKPTNNEFVNDPLFENIVFGYDVLLQQKIEGYQTCLKLVEELNDVLDQKSS